MVNVNIKFIEGLLTSFSFWMRKIIISLVQKEKENDVNKPLSNYICIVDNVKFDQNNYCIKLATDSHLGYIYR